MQMSLGRKIRYGMVGGGPGALIGAAHRMAASITGELELAAGSFSASPEKSQAMGRELYLPPERVYDTYQQMAEDESRRPEGERIDFVAIVTPNYLHFPIARAFLEAGFHVVCDKPMTNTIEEAEELRRLVAERGVVFGLTHNYTGYPLVKQARAMVKRGDLGEIRKVVVEYPQGWLHKHLEASGHKQAAWRTDPAKTGITACMADIGSHAENLAHYITMLKIEELFADLTTFVPGRLLDDDANLLLHYRGGARGILYASQVSVGEENNLRIRVYGTKASLEWRQEQPDTLTLRTAAGPEQVYRKGCGYLEEAAKEHTLFPPGHPEGYLEAFAGIYRNVGRTIAARLLGREPDPLDSDFPTVEDGLRGVRFIHKAVESSRSRSWVRMD